jgi:hypothetical protein
MKIIVVALLILVIVSLFSGLFYLFKDKGQGTRVVKALTLRVGLSITIFLILMASYYFGLIPAR